MAHKRFREMKKSDFAFYLTKFNKNILRTNAPKTRK